VAVVVFDQINGIFSDGNDRGDEHNATPTDADQCVGGTSVPKARCVEK